MLDQGLAKKAQEQRHCYANRTDIHGNRILSLPKTARNKRKEKGSGKKKEQELEQDKNRIVSGQ
jgi:hypothetical protein